MTREEAIKVLNGIRHLNYRNFWDEECDEAIDIAIKELSEDKTDRMTREEAIADIKNNIKPVVGGKSLDMAIEALSERNIARDIATILENEQDMRVMLQNADRPKGEWIKKQVFNPELDKYVPLIECSVCGYEPYFGGSESKFNYCANCGARMEK